MCFSFTSPSSGLVFSGMYLLHILSAKCFASSFNLAPCSNFSAFSVCFRVFKLLFWTEFFFLLFWRIFGALGLSHPWIEIGRK